MREQIERAIEFGNLRYKIVCLILDKMGYSNHSLHKLEVRNKVYRYTKKKYGYIADNYKCNSNYDKKVNDRDVWICWLQGIDQAPNIVKKCIKSIEYWLKDKQIHFIDKSNLFDYVELPEYIVRKWKEGIISNTLFSDFVRLSLLKKYGGMWVDATVFFTGGLPRYIEDSDFFMYRTPLEDEGKVGETWLIKAPTNDDLICLTLDILLAYWKKENKIKDYFLVFICMKIASERVGGIKERVLEVPNRLPGIMERYLNDKYDIILWNEICDLTPIHKLNYKRVDNSDGTFYKYILNLQIGIG